VVKTMLKVEAFVVVTVEAFVVVCTGLLTGMVEVYCNTQQFNYNGGHLNDLYRMKKHNQNNLTVVKHNDLNRAGFKLTLDERRLILSSVAKLDPRKPMVDEVKIYASEFAHQWDVSEKHAYKQLKEARQNLFDRKISLRGNKKGRDIRWIYDAEYADGEGYIKISFSPTVKPYLSELKSHFTSYQLTEVKGFKSGHAIRLYELMMQFKKTGWFDESLEDLKAMFGVADKYDRWVDFKSWVIEKAVKEVNEISNYTVKYETKKRGRKISRVTFFFHLDEQTDMFKS